MGEIEARRPAVVDVALAILAIKVVIGCFRTLTADVPPAISPAAFMATALIAAGLAGYLIALIAGGRNWARIVFSMLTLYGMLKILAFGLSMQDTPTNAAIRIATTLASAVAIALLFSPNANSWFRQARLLRAESQG